MTSITLLALLAAAEVSTSSPTPDVPERGTWSAQLSLASPTLVGASFDLGGTPPGIGVLGAVSRPVFSNGLTLERAFGEKWTGVASVSFGFTSVSVVNTTTGTGVIGSRWYAKRAFDGFWAGPELLFQLNMSEFALGGLSGISGLGGLVPSLTRSYAAGLRGRAGWTQPFGEHFIVTASAGLGANVVWQTTPLARQNLNLGLDVALAAGLVF
ncbi:MAG: hypothetical protein JNM17_23965 [Archangium sp.]|nr:hypothetical protein [Archangium sp.]